MVLQIKNLTKVINKNTVLSNICLDFSGGVIYGLQGKNGSGKTMLMRCICGLVRPTSGEIVINGEILGKDISFPRSMGALIEYPSFLNNYSGFKNLKLLASIQKKIDDSVIKACMQDFGLEPDSKKKFKKYSLGMKQKLGIVSAIMENPDILILDEPLNALDEAAVLVFKEKLFEYKNRGSIIIISCHDSEEMKMLADEIFIIENGQIINQ
ncbi:MAG: ATP-binding cassette domain-containing protein [Ruminococcaceae bacterium]|nr:ATP-binding cassette domain-containing protein [Oscillospiraceae bacterium]